MISKRDAGHVRGILDGLIRKWEDGSYKKSNAVMDAWKIAAGEEMLKHARPVSLKKGVMMVIVEDSVWLYSLTIEKRTLLDRFNKNYTGKKKAKDIRFRVGAADRGN